MQRLFTRMMRIAAVIALFAASSARAQQPPADSTVGMVGTTVISVHYRAPSVAGREIFGGTVPYGELWTLGGGQPATFRTLRPLTVGSTNIPRGSYTLYLIPQPAKSSCGSDVAAGPALLIVSKATGSGAANYSKAQDLARLPVRGCTLDQPVERLRMQVIPGDNSGVLRIEWDKTRYELPFDLAH
jgi:hypothetical protein